MANNKVRAFFSRRVPMYLLGADEVKDSDGFDAYPVEVDPVALANVRSLRRLVLQMEDLFETGSTPEDGAQTEADELVAEVRRIFKSKAQNNG